MGLSIMIRRSIFAFLLALLPLFAVSVPAVAAGKDTSQTQSKGAASILADIQQATWIRDGKSKHVIYVFFDPNCPYCHKLFDLLRPAVGRGEVELRWIPIGRLMASSIGKAAAMLEDKNPTEALYLNERGFSQETGSFGGILEEPVPRDDTLRRLEANRTLLQTTGAEAVPTMVFRTKDGKVEAVRGAPPAAALAKLIQSLE